MDQLKNYIKNLPDEPTRIAFAKRCGTTIGRIRKEISSKNGAFSAAQCTRIEAESGGKVSRVWLNPDGQKIWPEMVIVANGLSDSEIDYGIDAGLFDA